MPIHRQAMSSVLYLALTFTTISGQARNNAVASIAPPSSPPPTDRAGSHVQAADTIPAPCPVTKPNGSMPPASGGVTIIHGTAMPGERPDPHYYGNGKLWTVLWPGGTVLMTPQHVLRNGWLEMKWPPERAACLRRGAAGQRRGRSGAGAGDARSRDRAAGEVAPNGG
jgi:hypothetical protein